ncbi:hypothetical protein EXS71_00870 [Candidatus Uhrbacteria bacterium]|nr:hypothetical protein [Candidatus Uhrbacteria bacterium]
MSRKQKKLSVQIAEPIKLWPAHDAARQVIALMSAVDSYSDWMRMSRSFLESLLQRALKILKELHAPSEGAKLQRRRLSNFPAMYRQVVIDLRSIKEFPTSFDRRDKVIEPGSSLPKQFHKDILQAMAMLRYMLKRFDQFGSDLTP